MASGPLDPREGSRPGAWLRTVVGEGGSAARPAADRGAGAAVDRAPAPG